MINAHRNFLFQSSFAIHLNGVGFGLSNESMWFGPGFHSSLILSNNAPGFKHYFIGTLEQLRFKNYGLNFKFLVYENKEIDSPFFHSAFAGSFTIYNNPIITFGFARSFFSKELDNLNWTISDASKLVIKPLFGSDKGHEGLFPGEPKNWEPWDQSISGYLKLYFPEDKIYTYLELGTDDSRANMVDLRAHWDHNIGYIIGMRNYGIFNYEQIFYGIEYISTKNSTNTHRDDYYRGGITDPNYYTNSQYLYSTYGGRRIGAHSGSDSDDLIFLLGYTKNSLSSIISYNFERRGVSNGIKSAPEIKEEVVLSFNYNINRIRYSIYIENEKIWNYRFDASNKPRFSNVLGLSINFLAL